MGWDGTMGNGNPEKMTFAFNEGGVVSCHPPKTCRDPSTGAADRKEASEKIVEVLTPFSLSFNILTWDTSKKR
jgi:hypothetical protein